MILVTVGTQFPFDRLVKAMDAWAGDHEDEIFAQIGPARYRPEHFPYVEFTSPEALQKKTEEADIVVAHAGMGTIISALVLGKPVIVMPRIASLGEHRNDHQLATVRKLSQRFDIEVVNDAQELHAALETLRATNGDAAPLASTAPDETITHLRRLVFNQGTAG